MRQMHYFRAVREHSPGQFGVAIVSIHTGDVKEWESLHDTITDAAAELHAANERDQCLSTTSCKS